MSERPIFDPADFRIPSGVSHVCAGGETPFLHSHDAAMRSYAADKSLGPISRDLEVIQVDRARDLVVGLWGCARADIGFVSHVAEGIAMLVESIDWREGDNVCLDHDEFPSLVAPFAQRRLAGVELRFGSAERPLATLVDARTRVIVASHVSYLHGGRADLPALRGLADEVGAMLWVDHTQAAGWMPIEAKLADFAFSACYKWLLGTTGIAIAYWNRQRQPDWSPSTAGWHSLGASGVRVEFGDGVPLVADAMRFMRGNPAHAPAYVLANALAYLSRHDMAAVQHHVQVLTVALIDGLVAMGIPLMTPADPARHGASVAFQHPQARAVVEALARRGVLTWNGQGRVRFSFHGYNALPDVDASLTALRAIGLTPTGLDR